MGDWNQLDFARRHRHLFLPPALEVGSRDYGNTQDLRALMATDDYVGVDMEEGPGVDVVLDMTDDFSRVDQALGGTRFRTVFCLSVLEHCMNPSKCCDNISSLLSADGVVYVSVPHVWEIHDYPGDYWRFTPQCVQLLFPLLEFPSEWAEAAEARQGATVPLPDQPGLVWHSAGYHRAQGRLIQAMRIACAKVLLGSRALFAPTMLNMIGRKCDAACDRDDPPRGD